MKVDPQKVKERELSLRRKFEKANCDYGEACIEYEKARNRYYYTKKKSDKIELELLRLRQGQFNFDDLES